MKRKITIILLLLTTLVASSQEVKYINTSELNIREGAGTRYKVITKVVKNDKVTVLSERGKWSQIELENGIKGYVSTKFLTDNENSASLNTSKDTSLITYFFIFGFIVVIFGINKLSKFLGISSNSKNRYTPKVKANSSTKSTSKEKVNPNHWYHCKNCNTKIETQKKPTVTNCPNAPYHKWTDLGEAGNLAYNCKHCRTTVYTKRIPSVNYCSQSSYHKWTKLS
jgi:uncharacterized protein YgiM (DUF1202 family)